MEFNQTNLEGISKSKIEYPQNIRDLISPKTDNDKVD